MGGEKAIPGLPLTEVVDQLRREIVRAVDKAEEDEENLRFRLDKIQLELEVAVKRAGEGSTKADFWVLEFGAKGAVEKSRTQKVVLELTPVPKPSVAEDDGEGDGDGGSSAEGLLLGRKPAGTAS